MAISRRDFERSLQAKGFVRNEKRKDIYFFHEYRGRQTGVQTKVSHTKKMRTIAGDLLTSIRRQLRLDQNSQVADLVDCPLSKDQYNQILVEKKVFDPAESDTGSAERKEQQKKRKRGRRRPK